MNITGLALLSALARQRNLSRERIPLCEDAQRCCEAVKERGEELRKQAQALMEEHEENIRRLFLTIEVMHPETLGRNIELSEGRNCFRFVVEDDDADEREEAVAEQPEWAKELLAALSKDEQA